MRSTPLTRGAASRSGPRRSGDHPAGAGRGGPGGSRQPVGAPTQRGGVIVVGIGTGLGRSRSVRLIGDPRVAPPRYAETGLGVLGFGRLVAVVVARDAGHDQQGRRLRVRKAGKANGVAPTGRDRRRASDRSPQQKRDPVRSGTSGT